MNERQGVLPFGDLVDGELTQRALHSGSGSGAGPKLAPMLDETIIGVIVLREVDRALSLYPQWVHPFSGLTFNRAHRCYGQAHRDGRIVISRVFVGTGALDDLEDTVRHELAHLIIGIDKRHGPEWRRVARRLGAIPRARGRAVSSDLASRMDDAPYTLIAVLESGEERELKTVFRRSRRYLDYRYRWGGKRYEVEGQIVKCFRYEER